MSKKEKEVGLSGYTPEGKNAFKLSFVSDNLSHLLGEILTIVDASLEGERNKAFKDLVKSKFHEKQNWFVECVWKDIPQGVDSDRVSSSRPSDDWYLGMIEIPKK